MAQLTIAQRGELQLQRFNEQYINDIDKARYILNSYYRFVALYRRNAELEQNERIYNSRWFKAEEEKAERWWNRLSGILSEYGISIYVPWSMPFLGIKGENGCISAEVINPILY